MTGDKRVINLSIFPKRRAGQLLPVVRLNKRIVVWETTSTLSFTSCSIWSLRSNPLQVYAALLRFR